MKPESLKKGDKVGIVSLSRGILGMPYCKHELELGLKRLKSFDLEPIIMPNALKDIDYIKDHPEARAQDLKDAFLDKDIKAVFCAIGGDDTYKTIHYLMEDQEFINAVRDNPKIFLGFSDSTNNHLMFNKLGLSTFYGQSFLQDIAELDNEMLPYSKYYFERLFFLDEPYEITSSPIWYLDRDSYGPEQLGKPRVVKEEKHGYEVLNGEGVVDGKLYGGCLDTFYDIFTGKRYGDENIIYERYNILPTLDKWKEKILFLETSEEKMSPEKLEEVLNIFKDKGILESIKGLIVGKPVDEVYYEEYKVIYKKVFSDLKTPIIYNVNFGHSYPKAILPYDSQCTINISLKTIKICNF